MSYVEKTDTCWLWIGAKIPHGYGRFYFHGKPRYAHRVAMELFNGVSPQPDDLVMHTCDNPPCVNPDHLKIGTQTDNMRDASRKGRIVIVSDWRGTKNPKAKLTNEQRIALEQDIKLGLPYGIIARKFGVTSVRVGQIAKVVRGSGWEREDF